VEEEVCPDTSVEVSTATVEDAEVEGESEEEAARRRMLARLEAQFERYY